MSGARGLPHPSGQDLLEGCLCCLDVFDGQECACFFEQCFLDLEVFGVDCVLRCFGFVAGVEEHVLCRAEACPQLVVFATVAAGYLLRARIRSPYAREVSDQSVEVDSSSTRAISSSLARLMRCVAVVQLREVCAAVAVEGGAGCAETLPQLVLYALRQENFALCLLPRFEQFVHAGVGVLPVDLVGVLAGNLLGFRDDFFADGEGGFTVFGACLLLLFAEFSDLLCEGDEGASRRPD